MIVSGSQRVSIAVLGWLSTVAMSLCFLPALADRRYLGVGAFFAAVVVATAVLLRLVRTPAVLVVVTQLLVLAEGLVLAFGSHLRYAVLPTHETFVGIRTLLHSGIDISQRYAAPAPRSTGLLLMVVFLIALVAIAVDCLAVGLGRVPLAGLPLLALYTVPVAALPEGLPFYAFIPGAACFIATLTADERDRLARWGRLVVRVPSDRARAVDLSALRASGRRIGLVALSTAVVLPVFVPAFSTSILDRNRHTGLGSGSGATLSFSDPMVSLAESLQRKDPVDLLTVSAGGADGSRAGGVAPRYLRLTVLDNPGPNAWTAEPVALSDTIDLRTTLPGPTGLGPEVLAVPHSMVVTLTAAFPGDSAWLPVPFDAQYVGAGPEFGYVASDQTVSVRTTSAMQSVPPYRVAYSEPEPTARQLRSSAAAPPDIVSRYGDVPAGVPQVVADTARAVTAAARTPYDQAVLLQSFFRDSREFTYDLNAGYGYGYSAMADFLDQRGGFCQHFAATMAMMARTLNIPSRVVVGFLQSDHTSSDNQYVFTSHNVHSWPELYFSGVGWVRFEPTPGVNAPFPQYAKRTNAPDPPTSASVSQSIRNPLDSRGITTPAASAASPGGGSGGSAASGALPSTRWLILLGLAIAAAAPGLSRWGLRRSRLTRPIDAATAAESAWAELRDSMVDLRLPWTGSMTPRARERTVGEHLGNDAEGLRALHRLTLSVERARYADSPLDGVSPASDVRQVTTILSRAAGRGRRAGALLLPASLAPDLRSGWTTMRSRLRRPGRFDGSVAATTED